MPIVPESRLAKLNFFKNKKEVWSGEEAAIGLLPADTTQLGVLNGLAQTAYDNHVAAQASAKTATAAWNTAIRNLGAFGSDCIIKIKSKAQSSGAGADAVYQAAELPAPATPTPVGPPGTATDFEVELLQGGAVKLSFKCSNPAGSTGVVYQVYRRVNAGTGAGGEFVYVGPTGKKSITDTKIPAGATSVTYQITAIRSTSIGNPAEFNVSFGMSGSGEMIATVAPAGGTLAA